MGVTTSDHTLGLKAGKDNVLGQDISYLFSHIDSQDGINTGNS